MPKFLPILSQVDSKSSIISFIKISKHRQAFSAKTSTWTDLKGQDMLKMPIFGKDQAKLVERYKLYHFLSPKKCTNFL